MNPEELARRTVQQQWAEEGWAQSRAAQDVARLPRTRGRPLIDPAGGRAQVRIRLNGAIYDAVYAQALAEGQDVPSMIRDLILRGLLVDRSLLYPRP